VKSHIPLALKREKERERAGFFKQLPSDQNVTESFNLQGPRKDGAASVHSNTKRPYKERTMTLQDIF